MNFISKEGCLKFIAAFMSAVFAVTFLPLNEIPIWAAGGNGSPYKIFITDEFGQPITGAKVHVYAVCDDAGLAANNDMGSEETDINGEVDFYFYDYLRFNTKEDDTWRSEIYRVDVVAPGNTGYQDYSADEVYNDIDVVFRDSDKRTGKAPEGFIYMNYADNTWYTETTTIKLECSNYEDYISFNSTELHYDGKEHYASELFEIDDSAGIDVSYFDENGKKLDNEPSFKEEGDYKFTAKFEGKGYKGYIDGSIEKVYEKEFNIKISKKVRDIVFEKTGNQEIELKVNSVFTNAATCTDDPSANIVYSITSEKPVTGIATIDSSSGEVTLKQAGEVEITATLAETDEYAETSVSYKLTANRRVNVGFEQTTITSAYDKNATITNPLTYPKDCTGVVVTYSLEDGDEKYASIDSKTGVVTLLLPTPEDNPVTVTASFSADYCIGESRSYDLIITKNVRKNILPDIEPSSEYMYGTEYSIFSEPVDASIVSIEVLDVVDEFTLDYIPGNSNDYAEIKTNDEGILVLAIKKAGGDFSFRINVGEDDKYLALEEPLFIEGTTAKATQPFNFSKDYYRIYINLNTNSFQLELSNAEHHGDYGWYSIEGDNDLISHIDSMDIEGDYVVVKFKDNIEPKYLNQPCKFCFFLKGDDDKYESKKFAVTFEFVVNSGISTEVKYQSDCYNPITFENDDYYYYNKKVTVSPDIEYIDFNYGNIDKREFHHEVTLSENGFYKGGDDVFFTGKSFYNKGSVRNICVDTTAPTDFEVEIIDPTEDMKPVEKLFYNLGTFLGIVSSRDIDVVVRAKDTCSGLWKVEYTIGNSAPNVLLVDDLGTTDLVENSFKINGSGLLIIKVFDRAGNIVSTHDESGKAVEGGYVIAGDQKIPINDGIEVIVDNTPPVITVSFDPDNSPDDLHFNVARTATITIEETYFVEEDLEIKIQKDGEDCDLPVKFTEDSNNGDIHYATIEFIEDGEYYFSISYSDLAKNDAIISDLKDTDKHFIIDTTRPIINLDFDNNDCHGIYFSKPRVATVRVSDKNFSPKDLSVIVERKLPGESKATQLSGVDLDDIMSAQTIDGIYTVEIKFDQDAEYTFNVKCVDLANNSGDLRFNSNQTCISRFVIDTTAPEVVVDYDNNDVHNGQYFNKIRVASILIKDSNIDPNNDDYQNNMSKVDVSITAENSTTNSVKVPKVSKFEFDDEKGGYVATVEFTDEGEYTFGISVTDMAGNVTSDKDVDVYESAAAPTKFVIDMSKPDSVSILVDNDSLLPKSGDGSTIVFDKFYNAPITIKLSADCDISGMSELKYQMVDHVADYTEDLTSDKWIDYDPTSGIVVYPDMRFILYVAAVDNASNVAYCHSTGIVVDNESPEGEQNAPDIDILPRDTNINNGFYIGDVTVDIKIVDPAYRDGVRSDNGYFSGLKNAKITIYASDINAKDFITVNDFTLNSDGSSKYTAIDGLIYSWSKQLHIDAQKFNSNNVYITVEATDNSGNTRTTTSKAIKIDVTAPTIEVSYNNNEVGSDNCFKADRVATIVVTERNFNEAALIATITGSNGNVPGLVKVSDAEGSGNHDSDRHIYSVSFTDDGDYTFDVTFTDEAGHKVESVSYESNTVAANAFTIDKTAPVINVSYDNNDVANEMYYKGARTATISIVERNFNASNVKTMINATDNGKSIEAPNVSGWTSNGDTHTATIVYSNDGRYVFDISVSDNAGNNSSDFTEQVFVIDQTVPELTITDVKDHAAYNGDVAPKIIYSDTNFSVDNVSIKLTGAKRGVVSIEGTTTSIHNGSQFVFSGFAAKKEMDDIYTLEVKVVDLAGNESFKKVVFSINRFGSTYLLDDATKAIIDKYVQTSGDIVVSEVNVDKVSDICITLFKNNVATVLNEGVDYDIEVTGGDGDWYEYKYHIHADNFTDDGVYSILIHSKDAAGNVSENTLDTKDSNIRFGVDSTKPNIISANLEKNTTYPFELYTARFLISDNLVLESVEIYLDGSSTPSKVWSAEEVANIVSSNGEFTFDITDFSNSAHDIRIVSVDAAGNVQEIEIDNFYVTTNLFVRFYTNTPLLIGLTIALLLIVAIVIFIVVMKRRKYNR